MTDMIAYCGLNCTQCPSLIATAANDIESLKATAKMAREQWGVADATWETVKCTGCKGTGVRIAYCADCKIRECAEAKGMETCAHCDDYACCEVLNSFIAEVPDAKANLEAIRALLN